MQETKENYRGSGIWQAEYANVLAVAVIPFNSLYKLKLHKCIGSFQRI